ncbi:uncharacterized protein A4U43_C04F34760 [Asparagus officinalis]|uniref:Uncharacterized protein n=1 Tax=Asparagus officinalis TaxID=4686 RepID=A0A5P1FAE0_ASPOF|nr:uncharacterized protein A4U43_C04F34760 [Asparagus officinalis]
MSKASIGLSTYYLVDGSRRTTRDAIGPAGHTLMFGGVHGARGTESVMFVEAATPKPGRGLRSFGVGRAAAAVSALGPLSELGLGSDVRRGFVWWLSSTARPAPASVTRLRLAAARLRLPPQPHHADAPGLVAIMTASPSFRARAFLSTRTVTHPRNMDRTSRTHHSPPNTEIASHRGVSTTSPTRKLADHHFPQTTWVHRSILLPGPDRDSLPPQKSLYRSHTQPNLRLVGLHLRAPHRGCLWKCEPSPSRPDPDEEVPTSSAS